MSKRSLFLFSFVFVVLGLVDLVTTVQGFALGFVEGDGVFVPFAFTVWSMVVLTVINFVGKRIKAHKAVPLVVGFVLVGFCVFPVVNNLLLIGSVV